MGVNKATLDKILKSKEKVVQTEYGKITLRVPSWNDVKGMTKTDGTVDEAKGSMELLGSALEMTPDEASRLMMALGPKNIVIETFTEMMTSLGKEDPDDRPLESAGSSASRSKK